MANPKHCDKTVPEAKRLRKEAGTWLKKLRQAAGLSQLELAKRLGFKYYTFISQIENGFGRVPSDAMRPWAENLGVNPSAFARRLLSFYDPDLYQLVIEGGQR